jgi:hypothetical protein
MAAAEPRHPRAAQRPSRAFPGSHCDTDEHVNLLVFPSVK